MRRKLLPFYDERKAKIDMIIIHCTAQTPQESIKIFCERKVSSHYTIGEDGEIWQMVGEAHRAWHAGVSSWQGKTDINSHSIGIELTSPTLGQKPYPKAQKEALCALLQRLVKKYKIQPQNIVGHSDVAPTRKADPGKEFFWKDLAAQGLSFWPDKHLKCNLSNHDEKELLQIIGYDTSDLAAAKLAFCRHYMPQTIAIEKDVWSIEKNLTYTIKNFKESKDFREVLINVAQQYARASKKPCKM